MNIVIFGRGRLAESKYLPSLLPSACQDKASEHLRVAFVDVKGGSARRGSFFPFETWRQDLDISVGEIDKILVLSAPQAHLPNVRSIAEAYGSDEVLPEIFVEKPLYLTGEGPQWRELLEERDRLRDKAYYVDHYRFKATIGWFLREKRAILGSLGPIEEIAFVSMEALPFWDSDAFRLGYFLEHGCHFVTLLHLLFPELLSQGLTPLEPQDWRTWAQRGRPPEWEGDSAALCYLGAAGDSSGTFAERVTITAITGKGMNDSKFLYARGSEGSCRLWFNAGRMSLHTSGRSRDVALPVSPRDSYQAVVESIFAVEKESTRLLPLERGVEDQEATIAIRDLFPAPRGEYEVGNTPTEIRSELRRMGVYS